MRDCVDGVGLGGRGVCWVVGGDVGDIAGGHDKWRSLVRWGVLGRG